ncbi:MAG: hypothetical protein Q9182_003418 [Xanthomendoza sp. 2 TL-2023]
MDNDGEQLSKPIPRFGSFRSHASAAPPQKPSQNRELARDASSHRHPGSKGRRHHQTSSQSTHSTTSKAIAESSSTSNQDNEQCEQTATAFTIDLRGDARNLDYKSNHGAPHFRPEYDRALGTKSSFRSAVHRNGPMDREKALLSKHIRADLKRSKILRIKPDSNSGPLNDGKADFIPLRPSEGRQRKRQDHFINQSSYGGREARVQNDSGNDTDSSSAADRGFEYNTDESESEDIDARMSALDEALRQRKVALSSHTKLDPTDWHAWVALVELQDELDGFHETTCQRSHTSAEIRSNAEVCLSIYSKALQSVVIPEGREKLYLGMMSKANVVWEKRKMWSEWQSIIKEHPLSLRLWKRYLDFHLVAFSESTLDETKSRYIDCLGILRVVRGREDLGHIKQSKAYGIQILVLLRLTLLLREGGYTEVAIAIWQALMEFEFNMPPRFLHARETSGTSSSGEDVVSAFEHFWDSEAPKIGERNAKGWLKYNQNELEKWTPLEAEEAPSQDNTHDSKSWLTAERKAGRSSNTPSRATDEPLDDPYRIVLFSDVSYALIKSPAPFDNCALVGAFLSFCHLPPWSSSFRNGNESWYSDQFVRNEFLYDTLSALTMMGVNNSVVGIEDQCVIDNATIHSNNAILSNAFELRMSEYERSSDTFFSTCTQWFSAFGPWTDTSKAVPNDVVLRTLNVLVAQDVGGDELAEYLLAFELHVSPTTARKSAKNLLKKRSSSLRLYNAYALIEHRLGNPEAANKVWDTAIQMSAKLDESARRDAILLWRSRVWQYLSSGQTSEAMQYISRYGSRNVMQGTLDAKDQLSDGATATVRLRLQNAFSAGRDHMLSLGQFTYAVLYSELLILSEYLTQNSSIPAAQTSFRSNLTLLDPTRPSTQSAHASYRQSFARLLCIHATYNRSLPPSTIRSFLAESIAAFPHNTIFLSLYAWNESRFRIDDRVRGIMQDVVFSRKRQPQEDDDERTDHVTSHFFAVATDLRRGLVQGSNQSAVRGTFERALASEAAAHSAGLWKLYFLYEQFRGDFQRARAVFYRAITACPWVKELCLLAFEYLAGGMSEAELRGIYDVMVEKELRIHVDMYDSAKLDRQ